MFIYSNWASCLSHVSMQLLDCWLLVVSNMCKFVTLNILIILYTASNVQLLSCNQLVIEKKFIHTKFIHTKFIHTKCIVMLYSVIQSYTNVIFIIWFVSKLALTTIFKRGKHNVLACITFQFLIIKSCFYICFEGILVYNIFLLLQCLTRKHWISYLCYLRSLWECKKNHAQWFVVNILWYRMYSMCVYL